MNLRPSVGVRDPWAPGPGRAVAPRGPRGRVRAGRAPHSGLAASSASDTVAVSGEQDQPGGPGRERAGRLHGRQGHAPQGRAERRPCQVLAPRSARSRGPCGGTERPAARGRPGANARPSAAFPTEDTAARWRCGRLARVLRGRCLHPAVLGVRKVFASLRALWSRQPGGWEGAMKAPGWPVRDGGEPHTRPGGLGPLSPWLPVPPGPSAASPGGWRWAGGAQGSLTSYRLPAQEGANINKSLTTLGKVISALAEMVSGFGFLEPDQWVGP